MSVWALQWEPLNFAKACSQMVIASFAAVQVCVIALHTSPPGG